MWDMTLPFLELHTATQKPPLLCDSGRFVCVVAAYKCTDRYALWYTNYCTLAIFIYLRFSAKSMSVEMPNPSPYLTLRMNHNAFTN